MDLISEEIIYGKNQFLRKYLAIGIILLFVSTSNIPGSAQIRSVITNTSTSEDLPDLTIVDVIGEISMDGPDLICVVKNIGTAPSAEYHLQADEYVLFGLLHVNHLDCYGFPYIKAGETENIELGCPQPFIGILRLRCYISTTIPEANYNNNRFTHSYFIVNMFPFWSIKKLPF